MKRNVVGIRTAAILCALVAGAAIFASCATTGKRVTVLTYNTHLFGGSTAESGQELKNLISKEKVETVFDDDNRAEAIARKLETCGADIVALQELWSCDRPKWFANRLKKVYPHSYHSKQQCQYASSETLVIETLGEFALRHPLISMGLAIPWPGTITSGVLIATRYKNEFEPITLEIIKKKYKLTDGLLLLSKYPIETPMFREFLAGRTGVKTDQLARKGVITATIVLPNGLPLRVGVTHANTDVGGPSQPDMADLAEWTTMGSTKGPAIMMGDLNVVYTVDDAAKYNKMANIFTGVGAIDADRQVNKRNGSTINWAANPLLLYFFPTEKDQRTKSLDYVFYRPDGPGLTIKPESAKVITDWKYRTKMKGKTGEIDLSDHYPVVVTFSLWDGPNPITWIDHEPPRTR